jgi:hypothetical protein
VTEPKKMISKADFVKLRSAVLDNLRRNADGNGWAHIRHDNLESFSRRVPDCRAFSGMAPVFKSGAATIFWNTLLKAGDVVKGVDPLDVDGKFSTPYCLPGTLAFSPQIANGMEPCPNCESAMTGGRPDADLSRCVVCKGTQWTPVSKEDR